MRLVLAIADPRRVPPASIGPIGCAVTRYRLASDQLSVIGAKPPGAAIRQFPLGEGAALRPESHDTGLRKCPFEAMVRARIVGCMTNPLLTMPREWAESGQKKFGAAIEAGRCRDAG